MDMSLLYHFETLLEFPAFAITSKQFQVYSQRRVYKRSVIHLNARKVVKFIF